MTATSHSLPGQEEVQVVEELLRSVARGQRALQMYLPNNPVYQRAIEQLTEAFAPVWTVTGRLVLDILEHGIEWEGTPVYRQPARGEGTAWQLYKDGLRRLTLLPGVESEEIVRFLQVVNAARLLPADASDDLLTLLWGEEFVLISYTFVEVIGDGVEFMQERAPSEPPPEPEAARREMADARAAPDPTPLGVVDLTEFDATPYFLDDAEKRLIRTDLDEEYRRDIRQASIDALLDILETQRDPGIRHEVVGLLEDILPAQLAAGGFRIVARIIRELRVISARAHGLDEDLHRAVLSFEERLSQPEILDQLFGVFENSSLRPSDDDVGEVLRELKPTALPTVLTRLGGTLDSTLRRALEGSVAELARGNPQGLATVLTEGPPEALVPAIRVTGRLGLTQLVPAIVGHLRNGTDAVRLAAVQALGEFGTPSAVDALEEAVTDEERMVRQEALGVLLKRGGSGGLLPRLEELLFSGGSQDWERTERRTLFEAYATVAGPDALSRFRELLEPRGLLRRREPAEVRACAIYGLARVRTFDARLLVDRYTTDKDAVVRSAANAVLRDWIP
jgi:HEAT repeats